MKKLIIFLLLNFFVAQEGLFAQELLIPSVKHYTVKSDSVCDARHKPLLVIDKDNKFGLKKEGYRLDITPSQIEITAIDQGGLVYGQQTLRQLQKIHNDNLPDVEIIDYPSFPIRAFMHDTGRNFIEIDMLKRHIDLMSQYKLNVFHWHLTDNPAWRIECKVYPQLNDPKFQRKGRDEGRFYTYQEIRDVIQYAALRNVMIIPEIDMPGHSQFFNATFGFSMDSKEGMAVLEKCLDEFFKEIPKELCPYFHIGSDEVHIGDPVGFMKWAEGICKKYDRQAIAWNPGLPASSSTIVQVWNEASAANTAGAESENRYLDSSMGYLNYYDPIVFTNRLFLHNPCSVDAPSVRSMGGVLCLWNDVNVDDKSRIELHNGMLNGMLPYAERFWNGGIVIDTNEVKNLNVLPAPNTKTGKKLSAFERKMIFHRDNLLKDHNMRWVANAAIPFEIKIDGKTIKAYGGAIDMIELCSAHNIKVLDTMRAKATTIIYSNCDTKIRAWVGFDTPARSNRIGVGIGGQGKWESGSKIKVNGIEILPPQPWEEPGAYNCQVNSWHKPQEEMPYTDEQFYWMRTPAIIELKRGENVVEMEIVKTFAGQRWSFAFIPLTLYSDNTVGEVEGITYK